MPISAFPLELKSLTAEGTFSGLVAVYGNVDDGGDICEPGCFTKTLQAGATRPLLLEHRTPAIDTVVLSDSPKGLVAEGRLTLAVQAARDAYELMKSGAVRGMSFGYQTLKEAFIGEIRRLLELRVFEASVVTMAMNPLAQITSVKAREQDAEIRRALADLRSGVLDAIQRKSSGTPVPGRFRL
jgi:uncharacterized protein